MRIQRVPAIIVNNFYSNRPEFSLLLKKAVKHDAEVHMKLDPFEEVFMMDSGDRDIAPTTTRSSESEPRHRYRPLLPRLTQNTSSIYLDSVYPAVV